MTWRSRRCSAIHERSLAEYGGDPGVRDQGLLESAVAQPRARFGGNDLYPSIAEKAAALAFSLVKNHPFFDGNKRTGYGAMMMFLSRNGHTINAPLDEHVVEHRQLGGRRTGPRGVRRLG